MSAKVERIQIHLSVELKQLAERAAFCSGYSLNDYLAELVRRDAPKRLNSQVEIQLTNQCFDDFSLACGKANPLQETILNAAERLDKEGF